MRSASEWRIEGLGQDRRPLGATSVSDRCRLRLSPPASPRGKVSKNKRWRPNMEEAANAVAALQDLDAAISIPFVERARELGFVLEQPPEEVRSAPSEPAIRRDGGYVSVTERGLWPLRVGAFSKEELVYSGP